MIQTSTDSQKKKDKKRKRYWYECFRVCCKGAYTINLSCIFYVKMSSQNPCGLQLEIRLSAYSMFY